MSGYAELGTADITYFEKLKGVFPPLITPLDQAGNLDETVFRKVIRRTIDAGADGVVVLGSSGEGPMLDSSVRTHTIKVAVDEAAGAVPVVVGTGDINTRAVIENNRKAAELGAYACLLIPPFYFSQTQKCMIDFYLEVASEGSLPAIIYNFPQISKFYMEPASLEILSKEENIVGVKDSSGNFISFQAVLNLQSEKFVVYQGVGAISCASLLMKAGGFISPVANVDPDIEVEMYRAIKNGNIDQAINLQKKIQQLIGLWRGHSAPVPSVIKALLGVMGVCETIPCKPNPVVAGEELEALRRKYNLITNMVF